MVFYFPLPSFHPFFISLCLPFLFLFSVLLFFPFLPLSVLSFPLSSISFLFFFLPVLFFPLFFPFFFLFFPSVCHFFLFLLFICSFSSPLFSSLVLLFRTAIVHIWLVGFSAIIWWCRSTHWLVTYLSSNTTHLLKNLEFTTQAPLQQIVFSFTLINYWT